MKTTITKTKIPTKQWTHLVTLIILTFGFTVQSYSQSFTTIGAGAVSSGTSTNIGPIYRSSAGSAFDFSKHYYLYTAAELSAAGITSGTTITSIAFFKDNALGTAVANTVSIWRIHMKNTSTVPGAAWSSSNYATQSTGATLVYNNTSQTIPLVTGFITLTLSTPFVYTGGSLEIGSDWDCSLFVGSPATGGFSWKQDNVSNVCFGSSNSTSTITMALQTRRPQIQIGYAFSTPCSGSPVSSTSVITTAPSCSNNFLITQPFYPFADMSYRWVESSTLGGPYSAMLVTDTFNTLSKPTSSTTMYYRNIVTCNNSGLFDTAAAIQVDPPVIAGGTTSIITASGCATPGFSLGISGATAGTLTYQWQDSLAGGAWANTSIATASSTNTTLAATANVTTPTYFRRQTICVSSSVTSNSSPVLVNEVTGGIAAATAPICGDSLTVSLSLNTSGVGVFYLWEESLDTITWNPIPGDSTATKKVISPSTTNYYRCIVNCGLASGISRFVKVLPVKGGTTTLSSSFCGDSTLVALSGASTGTPTYNWLSSTDSVTWTSIGITTATAKFPTSVAAFSFYRCVVGCGLNADTSIAVKVLDACGGFGPYSITKTQNITFNSIQSTGTQYTWNGASGDDDYTIKVPLTFPFSYSGGIQTAFYVSTNGWLTFDTTTLTNNLTNDLNSTNPRRVIAPLWDDLVTLGNSAANRSYIKYEFSGTAPNRVLTAEWGEMERYNYGSPSVNFQVKLYETSNNIELVYGRMQPFDGNNTGAFDYSTGLSGNTPSVGQKLALKLENSGNFSSSVSTNNLSILPSCNSSVLFTNGGVFNPTTTSTIPSNDSLGNPILITVNPLPCTDACGTYYSSRGATPSPVAIAPVSGTPDDDVWFQFVAPLSGQVNISLVASSGYNPAFMVMDNLFDTLGLGAAASVNTFATALETTVASGLISGNTYFIRVFHADAGAGSTSGSFSICVNEVIPPPANDDTTGAFVIVPASACSPTAGTTIGSTASAQAVCGGIADDDVWFKFTPSASVDTVVVTGIGTFRPHVQVLSSNMTSLSCQNINVNAGTVTTTLTGLLKDSIYFVRVYHTNAGTATSNFTICITGDSATTPVITTGISSGVSDVIATLSGTITTSGGYPITASGVVYSTTPSPIIGGLGVVDSTNSPVVTSGSFSKNIEGLSVLTTYYFRAYAINALGTSYGADSSFTTLAVPNAPTINAVAATSISTTGATMGATIVNNGGAAISNSGIVFGTTSNPIIGGPGVIDSVTSPTAVSGSFSFTTTGLTHSTKYYFRAYAINAGGTGYSIQDSFTTGVIINTLPYSEDFDGVTTPWTSATIGGGTNSWEKGTPSKAFINAAYSAPNAFVTKLSTDYLGSEDCGLISPQFDFTTSVNDPIIRFRHKMDVDNDLGYDGGVLEISINGGAYTRLNGTTGTGSNFNTATSYAWYNDATALLALGANKFSTITNTYASQTSGWIESATVLTGAAGQSNVKIRFRFVADGVVDEGWAIDNIEVVDVLTPTTSASVVNLTAITDTTTTANWTNGDGVGRLVVARLTVNPAIAPTNNVLYTPATLFGAADSTGLGNYITYKSTGSSVVVTGLSLLTDYTYDVYEYNGKYMHIRFAGAASNNGTTLPVKLSLFTATTKASDALLTWTTVSETNNKGFEVERSINGRTFEKVGFVKGAGNSNRISNYGLTDVKAFDVTKSNVLYYRLKQVDFDGKYTYSQIVRVTKNAEAANALSVYPNPYSSAYGVSFNAAKDGVATIEMLDLQGKVVATLDAAITSGNNLVPITEANNLNTGIYFVRLTVNGETQITKLVKN